MNATCSRSTDARSLDATLALLRNERRRYALAVLSGRDSLLGGSADGDSADGNSADGNSADGNSAVPLRELAEAVAVREAEADSDGIGPAELASDRLGPDGPSPDEIPTGKIERVAVSLHHTHLPKLADAGAVAYDAEAGTVSLAQTGDLDFAALLDAAAEPE